MRVKFRNDDLKVKLVNFAFSVGMSLNELVNLVLAAQFNDKDKKSLQLLHDLKELTDQEV
jgi:hypothetical protein